MKSITLSLFSILLCLIASPQLQAEPFTEIEDLSDLPLLNPDLNERVSAKIRLKNGLEALLISDPKADQSAAALAVKVGSWDDPIDYPGTAHFCEHMLFKGTKLFPGENEFSTLIADYNGLTNAFTAPDRTVYMFSCGHEGLNPILERFSRFFIDPLFNPSGIARELHAVDQEYSKNIENDAWREYMVFKETANPEHPNAKFSTGNAQTLSQIPQSTLKEWHANHYCAEKMRLVIYSNQPIECLKTKAALLFADVPHQTKPVPEYTGPISSDQQKGNIIQIEPIKETQQLTLSWELPTSFSLDPSNPAELLSYALNRGQPHNLKETLKKEGYIRDLSFGVGKLGGNAHKFFEIVLDLTDQGLQNWEKATLVCFQALKIAQTHPIPSYLYDEMNRSAQLKYQYQSRKNGFNYVIGLAQNLLDEDLATFPRSQILAHAYRPKHLQSLAKSLRPENCLYVLMAPSRLTNSTLNRQEKWLGAHYDILDISKKQMRAWQNASAHPDIAIPDPNPFFPNQLTLEPTSKHNHPILFAEEEFGKAYYYRASEFQVPHASISLHFSSPLLTSDPKSACLKALYLDALSDQLDSTLSAAGEMGMQITLGSEDHRLNLSIEGFSDKSIFLLQEIIKELSSPLKLSEKTFQAIVSTHRKNYANAAFDPPAVQAKETLTTLLRDNRASTKEKLHALQTITYSDLLTFSHSLFHELYTEAFFSGNLAQKDAESAWLDIRHLLGNIPFLKNHHFETKVLSLSNQGPFQIHKDIEALGNATFLILDFGTSNFEKRASHQILSAALRESFFDTLRSKQKTGYIVQSDDLEIESRLFQYFCVQSNSHEASELLNRFELFIETSLEELTEAISESRFEILKNNLIYALSQTSERSLRDKTALLDHLAFEKQGDFHWIQKRIEGFENLNYETFIKEAQSFLSRNNRKRLAILVNGKKKKPFAYLPIKAEEIRKKERYLSQSDLAQEKEQMD